MEGGIYRLIDANANRAREGLRVVEDYARFVLDDAGLCEALKRLRHELGEALRTIAPAAIAHRDTPHDVGTALTTPAELQRAGLADVIIANSKRLGEALRSLEEYAKTLDASAALRLEAMRYRFYDIEQRLARTLRPRERFARVRLYVLITESVCTQPWLQAAAAALEGGADCLQLREKSLEGGELLRRARALVALCRSRGALCIINDRADIAALANADGVHVGQGDLPALEARKIVGPDRLVGVSTHSLEHAKQAVLDGADYIGVGPVFRSATKPRDFIAGLAYARDAASQIRIPAVAIAGITRQNVAQVAATGVAAIAVTASVLGCEDVTQAAREMKRGFEEARKDKGATLGASSASLAERTT